METVMVVEVLGPHDRVRARHRLTSAAPEVQCTVGRAANCDVVLDDPFVAAVHARLSVDTAGDVFVSDLDSVNGVEIDGQRRHGVARARVPEGVFRVGRTRLRVRTGREVIAPEQVDRGGPSRETRAIEPRVLATALAASVTVTMFEVWTNTAKPSELSTALVTTPLAMLAIAGLWIALWALASRVAFGESRWARHAMIAFACYASVGVVASAAEVVNGALGLHLSPSVVGLALLGVGASAALTGHLTNASPMPARIALAIGVTIPAVVVAVMLWLEVRGENRSPSHIIDHDPIVPPALVLRRGLPFDAFTVQLADLKVRADAKRAFVEREDPSPDEDASE